MEHKTTAAKSGYPVSDSQWALVQRVAACRQLEKSARLRSLFLYLCEQLRKEAGSDLREQRIGCEFFGRPENYDTGQDNIVRVQVSMLRKRLREYFAADGREEPYSIEIPPGGYLPVFREHGAEETPDREPLPAQVNLAKPAANRTTLVLAAALAIVSCIAAWLAWDRHRLETARMRPDGGIWSQLFAKGRQTDIVLADSNLALMEDLLQRPVTLADYVNRSYTQWLDRYPAGSEQRRLLDSVNGRLHTSLADVRLLRTALLYSPTPQSISVQYARNFDAASLKTDNVVLLGSKKSNPWIEAVESKLSIRFEWPPGADHESLVSVRTAGEQGGSYSAAPFSGGVDLAYCLIALLPNPSGPGDVLIVGGTNAQATEVGGELLVPPSVNLLRSRLGITKSQAFPYFEALVRSTHIGGAEGGLEIISAHAIR